LQIEYSIENIQSFRDSENILIQFFGHKMHKNAMGSMRIIVCVKQIRYTYAQTGRDPDLNYLEPEDHINRVNPYDEAALELALRSREQLGEGEVFILTLGALTAETDLRRCLAMGADRLYQIEADAPMDAWSKSSLLTRAVKDLAADLVLCGKTSLDTGNGQIAAFIAHHLQMPFVSAITDLSISQDDRQLRIHRKASRGSREVIACRLPAVVSVELGIVVPRMPSFADKKRALSARIKKLRYDEANHSKITVKRVYPPRPRPKRVAAPDSRLDSYERINQLLNGSRVEKKGTLLTGSVESQVEGIMSLLMAHGFINSKRKASEGSKKS
jgi:electron transfer flavoprotein beta subunit